MGPKPNNQSEHSTSCSSFNILSFHVQPASLPLYSRKQWLHETVEEREKQERERDRKRDSKREMERQTERDIERKTQERESEMRERDGESVRFSRSNCCAITSCQQVKQVPYAMLPTCQEKYTCYSVGVLRNSYYNCSSSRLIM